MSRSCWTEERSFRVVVDVVFCLFLFHFFFFLHLGYVSSISQNVGWLVSSLRCRLSGNAAWRGRRLGVLG